MLYSRRMFLASSACAGVACCGGISPAIAQSASELHICTELALADLQAAYAIAVQENAANNPLPDRAATEAASLYRKKWNPERRQLLVDFVEQPTFADKIIKYAKVWEEHMGIRLVFGRGSPDILISLENSGSWSYIGTDSLYFSRRGRPSMNFGWFDESTSDEEFSRTTLHEFGHALSLIHEHQNPQAGISWNKEAVYQHYQALGWDTDTVNEQIFRKYELDQINGTGYDSGSIMHYPIPAKLVNDPTHAVGWNTKLSVTDATFIAKLYPKENRGLPS